jgi:drug/metabolite transporter (DMT)-like permease
VQVLALGLVLPGLVLLISPWRQELALGAVFLALASGLGWALGAIWQKRHYPRYRPELPSLTVWQMLYGGLLLPADALGWLLWVHSLHHLPTWVAGFGSLLVPGIGVSSAWLVLGETPTGRATGHRPGPFGAVDHHALPAACAPTGASSQRRLSGAD